MDDKHIKFLTADETLELQAGLTMKERVLQFTQKFPDKVISQTALYKLYKEHKIRRKQVKTEKEMTPYQKGNFDIDRQEILRQLKRAKDKDLPVLYLDEVVFSKQAILKRTWSGPNKQYSLPTSDV